MVEPSNDNLSIRAQCGLLSISRSGWYYDPKGEPPLNLKLMRLIDEQFWLRLITALARWRGICAGKGIMLVVTVFGG